MRIQTVGRDELLSLVDGRREAVRSFLEWAAECERGGWSLRMRARPDILRARDVMRHFPRAWWGLVVYSCFDSVVGAEVVAPLFQEPLDAVHAEEALGRIVFPRGAVGGHRIQPAVIGAKRALVAACAEASFFDDVLHSGEPFDVRYVRLRARRITQWGRTTCFDLLLRAGFLAVGDRPYVPEYAYLEGSTGPKKGFQKVWGVEVDGENAGWAEGVLRAWTDNWADVAARAGGEWAGDPYEPCDFENALCIWQEPRHD